MRRAALAAGVVFIAAAFIAATRVANTREGLIFEVITLFAGLAGVIFMIYGLVTTLGRPAPGASPPPVSARPENRTHNAAELLVGGSGLAVAAILLGGIAATAGVLWALLGGIMLLPMIVGCAYLCVRFAIGPHREWKIDLQQFVNRRSRRV
jgi:hypothetical protein